MNKFAVLIFRPRVKVTVAILGKKKLCHGSTAFLWTDFDVISYEFNNIGDKCVFQQCRSKVNVTDAILGKKFVMVLVLFYELILIKLHTNVNYDNM